VAVCGDIPRKDRCDVQPGGRGERIDYCITGWGGSGWLRCVKGTERVYRDWMRRGV